jgi:hypothetical protein
MPIGTTTKLTGQQRPEKGTDMTDNVKPAFAGTKDILEEEANRLAMVLDNGRTDAALKDAGFPHRVEIAVHREIKHLRHLAAVFLGRRGGKAKSEAKTRAARANARERWAKRDREAAKLTRLAQERIGGVKEGDCMG